MGREIRKVPAGWEHPRYTANDFPHSRCGDYRPMFDESFRNAMAEWWKEYQRWESGVRPSYWTKGEDTEDFCEWNGGPPDPAYYRPDWKDEERTHFQFYQNVSEGSPLSPPMPSLEALADWLTTNRDFAGYGPMTREQADAFCRIGWAPSMVITGGRVLMNVEALETFDRPPTEAK